MNARDLLPTDLGLAPLAVDSAIDYRDKYRGALLGVGIGDALGRPAEGKGPGWIRADHGVISDFIPWRGWRGGPKGTLTDDSELTIALAESLVERQQMDPVDFGKRCAAWLHVGRGKGRATSDACQRLLKGIDWTQAGSPSAGNGAAMRSAPIGLFHPTEVNSLRRDAALSAVVTHADPTAVLSAVALSFLVAKLLHTRRGALDVDHLLQDLTGVLGDLSDPALPGRRPGGGMVRLGERLSEMGRRLDEDPEDLFAYTYNGAFVTESLPAALWCFLRFPDDPEKILITAVAGGYDADTVAAMAGALAGAYNGSSNLPDRWLDDLEYRDGFEGCADDLLDLAGLPAAPIPMVALSEVEIIDGFTGPFGFLSNSARSPFEVDGLRYMTVEHAYSARKISWEVVSADVRLVPTPAGAIERRRDSGTHDDWPRRRLQVMEQLVAAKFAPGSAMSAHLLLTGRAQLRNANWWGDRFWGTVDGTGENHLGRILESGRDGINTEHFE